MIIKSLLAASIVASTFIGATAPASAAVTLVGWKVVIDADTALPIQTAKQAPLSILGQANGVAIVHPDYKAAGGSVRDDKPSRSRDKKQRRGSKKHR